MKLFILGNGLDLATGYNTRPSDFRDFLETNKNKYKIAGFSLYKILSGDKSELWNEFEENLPMLLVSGVRRIIAANECSIDVLYEISEDLYTQLGNTFSDFIFSATREIKPMNEIFNSLFASGDKYLTFNYSQTLERVYRVPKEKVSYIHGCNIPEREEYENNNSIVYGHTGFISDVEIGLISEDDQFESYIREIVKSLEKKIDICYFDYLTGSIATYEEIQIIGHSLGVIDEPYFVRLNTKKSPKIVYWEFVGSKNFDYEESIKKVKSFFPFVKCEINFYDGKELFETRSIN